MLVVPQFHEDPQLEPIWDISGAGLRAWQRVLSASEFDLQTTIERLKDWRNYPMRHKIFLGYHFGIAIRLWMDTGANISLVGKSFLEARPELILLSTKPTSHFEGLGGSSLNFLGTVHLQVVMGSVKLEIIAAVLEGELPRGCSILLGNYDLENPRNKLTYIQASGQPLLLSQPDGGIAVAEGHGQHRQWSVVEPSMDAGLLLMADGSIAVNEDGSLHLNPRDVILSESYCIPARRSKLVHAHMREFISSDSTLQERLIKPIQPYGLPEGVRIRSDYIDYLIDTRDGSVIMEVINHSQDQVFLKASLIVGTLQPDKWFEPTPVETDPLFQPQQEAPPSASVSSAPPIIPSSTPHYSYWLCGAQSQRDATVECGYINATSADRCSECFAPAQFLGHSWIDSRQHWVCMAAEQTSGGPCRSLNPTSVNTCRWCGQVNPTPIEVNPGATETIAGLMGTPDIPEEATPAMQITQDPQQIQECHRIATAFVRHIKRISPATRKSELVAAKAKGENAKKYIKPSSPDNVSGSRGVDSNEDIRYQPLDPEDNANDDRHDGPDINKWTDTASISAALPPPESVNLTDWEFLYVMGALDFTDTAGNWMGTKKADLLAKALGDLLLFNRAGVFRLNYNAELQAIHGISYKVNLKPGMESQPVTAGNRRYSEAERLEICTQVLQLLKAGILRPSRSAWANGLVMVAKPGGAIRMCVDFRALNQRTVALAGSLPLIQDVINDSFMNDHLLFSHLDLSQAYHQLEVTEASQDFLAFNVPQMPASLLEQTNERPPFQVCFTRLPFGLADACTVFSNITQDIFRPAGIPTYLDDLAFGTVTLEQHIAKVHHILTLAVSHGLTFGLKCELYRQEIKCLGYAVNASGITIDPARVQELLALKTPSTVAEVQHYIGCVHFCAGFLGTEFASIIAPLTDLTRKEMTTFVWGTAQQAAIDKLKELLASPQILKVFDNQLPTMVATDGSKRGVGAVLLQQHGDQWFPVAYLSKKLSPVQSRWATSQFELFALILAVDRWRSFLVDKPFLVLTDHQALTYLRNPRLFTGRRLSRWQMLLSEFDFAIRYKAGTTMGLPDVLSRMMPSPPTNTGEDRAEDERELIAAISSWGTGCNTDEESRHRMTQRVSHHTVIFREAEVIALEANPSGFRPGQIVTIKKQDWNPKLDSAGVFTGEIISQCRKGNRKHGIYYQVRFFDDNKTWPVLERLLQLQGEPSTASPEGEPLPATPVNPTFSPMEIEAAEDNSTIFSVGDLVYITINHERSFLPADRALRPMGTVTSEAVDGRHRVQLLARYGDVMECDIRNLEFIVSQSDLESLPTNPELKFEQGDVVFIRDPATVETILRAFKEQSVPLDRCQIQGGLLGIVQRCISKNQYDVHFGAFESGVYTLSPKQLLLARHSTAHEERQRLLRTSPHIFSDKEQGLLSKDEIIHMGETLGTRWNLHLERSQTHDPHYGPIREWLLHHNDADFVKSPLLTDGINYDKRYKVENNLLLMIVHNDWRIVIPRALEETVIQLVHESQDHFDANRTYHFIQQYFYFENIPEKTQRFVGSCLSCQLRRNRQFYRDNYGTYIADLLQYTTTGQDWAIDLKKEDVDDLGYSYVLVMVDLYSRYVISVPLVDKAKETVVSAVYEHLISKFGHGISLLMDKGSEFINDYAELIFSKFNITSHYISERNPQGNGCCERFNRTYNDHKAKAMASKVLGHESWSVWLIHLTSTYNASYHAEIAQTPFFLMYGRDFDLHMIHSILPEGIQMRKKRQRDGRTIAEISAELDMQLKAIMELRDEQYQSQRQAHEIKKVMGAWGCLPNFVPGSKILIHLGNSNGGHSTKHRCHAGPFEVVGRLSNSSYTVQGADLTPVVVHAAKLLAYVPTYADMVGGGRLASSAVGAAESRLLHFRDTDIVNRKE